MEPSVDYYRRNLPHLVPPGATYFVTFRLAGSVPREVWQRWAEDDARRLVGLTARMAPEETRAGRREVARERFDETERYLDNAATGPRWLERDDIAALVANALAWVGEHKADMHAWCLMPNHAHVLLTPKVRTAQDGSEQPITLSEVMHSVKGFTGKRANRLLRREGAFWQHESYDHWVRDAAEHERIVDYILDNPLKAGLVTDPSDWPWSYPRPSSSA